MPSAARPPRSPAPAPTSHASPPPAGVPSPPSQSHHHKPLPTPATAADPAHQKAQAQEGNNKRRRKRETNGYRAGFMSPNSQQQLGGSSSVDPSVQTSYSAGTPRLQACVSDISMGNSRFFTYEELYQTTDGFSVQKLLGEGGFGSVYKGCLPDGKEVAVKQLKDGGGQGGREFQAEVEIISSVHHSHLVSLVGCCISSKQKLLVYDFVPNNTTFSSSRTWKACFRMVCQN